MNSHKNRIKYIIAILWIVLSLSACSGGKEKIQKESDTSPSRVFPVLNIMEGEYACNYLTPYSIAMSAESVYGPLTPVKNGEAIRFCMDSPQEQLVRIEYVLYEMSGQLIENGTLSKKSQFENAQFEIPLQNIKTSETCLEVKLCFSDEQAAYYYTRVVSGPDISSSIAYARNIENACLGKESPVDLTLAMEWDLKQVEKSYSTADIHSNFDQVTWGGLGIQELVSDYDINVVDCEDGIVSFRVSYEISDGKDPRTQYRICDFLRVREYDGEQFLLNFYRTTEEVFDSKESNFNGNTIYLGVGKAAGSICTAEDGKKTFFTANQSLYYYDYEANRINQVYSAGGEETVRRLIDSDCFKIYPLALQGEDFYFLAGGYLADDFNRYLSGVSLLRYDTGKNVYETVFVQPVQYDPEVVLQELDRLACMNEAGQVFFLRNGQICAYDIESGQLREEVRNVSADTLVCAGNDRRIAYNKKQDAGEDILVIRDLDSGDEVNINPKEDHCLTPIGFINEDFVYGISDRKENDAGFASDKQTLIYTVCIVDREGKPVKEYPMENGRRVLSGTINDTVIILEEAARAENGTLYAPAEQEQIVSGNTPEASSVTAKEATVSGKGNVQALVFAKDLKGMPVFSRAAAVPGAGKTVRFDALEQAGSYKDRYFVHAKGHLYGIYSVMREALIAAEQFAGVVTNAGNAKLYYRAAKDKTASVLPQDSALAAQLMNQENGIPRQWQALVPDKYVLDISGFTLDDALLFISRGFPVLARYSADAFVWIIGYTDKEITCQSASSEDTFRLSLEEAEAVFQKAGNEFYTCNQ